MISLKNKNIILTGSTGGIGMSILEKLVNSGANVIATGTNEDKLKSITNKFANVITKKFDISNHQEIEKFIDDCYDDLDKKIDVIINNAGITKDNLSIRMNKNEWDQVLNINLTSTFLLSKCVIRKMIKANEGKIINITSIVAHTGNLGQSNYSASKAAVLGMSKSLALEYAKKNIKVNCISPGFITSNMTDKINEKQKEIMMSKIPLARFGNPSDVANTALFLCSDLSNYITGETIHVNGGMYFS
tara:strand:- start:1434 stop:2171 length:738 start_codon:yes stop_codon:yes gene_type:complete